MIHNGLKVVEINGGLGFLDVQFSGHPIKTGAAPIEDPVSCVAILLVIKIIAAIIIAKLLVTSSF